MTGRERLIDLMRKGYETVPIGGFVYGGIADYLLANGVIVLPCKVGDTVYFLDYDTSSCNNCELFSGGYCGGDSFCTEHYSLYPAPCEEDEEVCPKHKLIVKSTRFSVFFSHRQKDFGKTVFLTREEAEEALKERADNV